LELSIFRTAPPVGRPRDAARARLVAPVHWAGECPFMLFGLAALWLLRLYPGHKPMFLAQKGATDGDGTPTEAA
jgi:hypothetical protein